MGAVMRRRATEVCTNEPTRRRSWPVLLALIGVLLSGTRGEAAVSCANPDLLCRNNPCVIHDTIEVETPCSVDFGDRDLVIAGAIKVPNGGLLSFSAGSIEVNRPILARHTKQAQGDGGTITLVAARNITVNWRLEASARKRPGTIQLIAGDDVKLLAPVRAGAAGSNPRASGGSVMVTAGGTIKTVHRARIRVHGDVTTAGGSAVLNAGRGILLGSRITASGASGGVIEANSTEGGVFVAEPIEATGGDGDGGRVSFVAASGAVNVVERVDVEGSGRGGSISVIGALPVVTNSELRAGSRVLAGDGGSVVVASDKDVTIEEVIFADGRNGGQVTVVSQTGTATMQSPVVAGGNRGIGGSVLLNGGTNLLVASPIDADGQSLGGSITAAAADVRLTSHGSLFARGDTGGTINVSGDMVTIPAGAKVLVDGDTPGGGSITFAANAGDLILDGDFRARGDVGGSIEGSASGDVVASGEFSARGNGCIAFSAGSTLDISGGAFDVPIAAQCL
jgi:hypothetical protein